MSKQSETNAVPVERPKRPPLDQDTKVILWQFLSEYRTADGEVRKSLGGFKLGGAVDSIEAAFALLINSHIVTINLHNEKGNYGIVKYMTSNAVA